jgi:hypothetical protein
MFFLLSLFVMFASAYYGTRAVDRKFNFDSPYVYAAVGAFIGFVVSNVFDVIS